MVPSSRVIILNTVSLNYFRDISGLKNMEKSGLMCVFLKHASSDRKYITDFIKTTLGKRHQWTAL